MREIKFRARTESGEWVYGTPHFNDTLQHYVEICGIHNGLGTVALLSTLGQFTGLKDANGKEIYEGDIVTARYEYGFDERIIHLTGPVVWDPDETRFGIITKGGIIHPQTLNVVFNYEVLGNIHDNPKLLQSNQK